MNNAKHSKNMKLDFRNIITQFPQVSTIIIFIVVVAIFSILSPFFFSLENLNNILQQTAAISISAFGITIVLLAGGIDLSIGSVIAVVGVVCATIIQIGIPIPLAIAVGIGIGIIFGLFNGFITTQWSVQPFLVTLGTMSIGRGLALLISGGQSIYIDERMFGTIFSKGDVLGIPSLLFWTFGTLVVMYIIVSKSAFGRRVQAIGGNREAAINSGIKVKMITILVFMIGGIMSAISGMVIASRLGSGLPTVGQGAELDAIAAAVLGGTGFVGEGGNMLGTLMGALVIGTVVNGLTILGVNSYIQMVVKGVIIILTVVGSISLTRGKN